MFLGIDTSLGTAVAVVEADGYVVSEEASENPLGHAEVIGRLIADATSRVPAVTHVAAGMGPGPFTGLRVGIAAARAFALGRGVPVVPVPSHDAVALGMLLERGVTGTDGDEPFAVVTDARRREFAYTVYAAGLDDDGLPVRLTEAALAPRNELDARLADLGAERRDAASVPASLVALAAARAVAAGRTLATSEPLYLRAPDVVANHTPKKVRA